MPPLIRTIYLKALRSIVMVTLLVVVVTQAYAVNQSKKLTAVGIPYRYHRMFNMLVEQDTTVPEQSFFGKATKLVEQASLDTRYEVEPDAQDILQKIENRMAVEILERFAAHVNLSLETLISPRYHSLTWSGERYILPEGDNYNFELLTDAQLINFANTADQVIIETARKRDGNLMRDTWQLRQEIWRYATKNHMNKKQVSLAALGMLLGRSSKSMGDNRRSMRTALSLAEYQLGNQMTLDVFLDQNSMRRGMVGAIYKEMGGYGKRERIPDHKISHLFAPILKKTK